MDAWIDALFKDLDGLEGRDRSAINESVRRLLAQYEQMFRDAEVDERKKDAAAQNCRGLIRARVVGEIAKSGTALSHRRIVLAAIDSPARAPLPKA